MRKKINYTEKNWQNLEAGKSEMKKKKKNQVTSIQLGLPRTENDCFYFYLM